MAKGLKDYWLMSDDIGFAAATVIAAEIPAKTLVVDVALVIKTAYVTGDAVTVNVGDGDDADGWVDEDNVTETTAATYRGTVAAGAAFAGLGKYYSSAGQIKAVVTGTNTAGAAHVLVHCISLPL